MNNLSDVIHKTEEHRNALGENAKHNATTYSLSIATVESVIMKDKKIRVFLHDENRSVNARHVIHVNLLTTMPSIKQGDLVLLLHKAGLAPMIIQKIDERRTEGLFENRNMVNTRALNASTV